MTKKTTTAEAPAPKRRRADAERSVAAILDAALEALASDPDSSMSEIARRAGVVRATIYVHFPTRESLLDAVMEYAVGQVTDAMRGAEPHRGEPMEALERLLREPGSNSRSSTVYSHSTRRGCLPRNSAGVTSPCSTSWSL
jgi:AcrR family transcriptional regulator